MKNWGHTTTQVSHVIDEWVFSERDRGILKRRLIDGICYEALAEEADLSVRQVKNIVAQYNNIITEHL